MLRNRDIKKAMLGSTHLRIAENICRELGIIEKRKVGLLLGGSTHPDSWANFPHHYGKENEISESIIQARKLYLEGDDECFHRLGIALHYIADRWTLRPRLSDMHTDWERKIDKLPIVDDSQLKEAITDSAIPTKIVQKTLKLVDDVNKGPSALSSPEQDFRWKVLQYSRLSRTNEETEDDKSEPGLKWSSPLFDLNFAYRICSEVSKAVLTPPPKENPSFYLRGRRLQEQLEKLPESYISDNWKYNLLQQIADINELIELTGRLRWNPQRKPTVTLTDHILIFDYDSLRMDEVEVKAQIKKITKFKTTAGWFRKREVEKERVIEETEERTVYRVHLEIIPVLQSSANGRVQGFLDCASKLCARYILDKLKWIANNPDCPERQNVRIRPKDGAYLFQRLGHSMQKHSEDVDDIVPDHGQQRVYIQWGDFVNLRIPAPEHLEDMYRRIDADQADLTRLKTNSSTWF